MEYIMGFPNEIRNLTQRIGFIRYLNQMIASDASWKRAKFEGLDFQGLKNLL